MTVVILATVNLQIASKERIVKEGTTVLLQLAPRDPRSLLQGDVYCSARFGDLRVAESGDAVLTGLRDDGQKRLGPP